MLPDGKRSLARAEGYSHGDALRVLRVLRALGSVMPVIIPDLEVRGVKQLVGAAQASLHVCVFPNPLTDRGELSIAGRGAGGESSNPGIGVSGGAASLPGSQVKPVARAHADGHSDE